jgi:hypothetical protein
MNMDATHNHSFDWEKDIYIQDFSQTKTNDEQVTMQSFDDSSDDDKENIAPLSTNANMSPKVRQSENSGRTPFGDITWMYREPSCPFDSKTTSSSDKGKSMARLMR